MTLTELEGYPYFKTLTWEEQKLARYKVLVDSLGGEEELNKLDPRVRQRVLSKVLLAEPAFENEMAGSNYLDILGRYNSPDKGVRAKAEEQLKSIAWTSAIGGSTGIFKTMMNALGGVAQRIAGVTPGEEMTWDAMYGKDARKMVEYSRELLDSSGKAYVDTATTIGGIVGMGLDFLAARAITGGLPTKLASAPFKELAATRTQTRIGTWLAGSIAPMAIENTGGGLVGVVREQLLRDPKEKVRFGNILKDFGEYAALDYVIGAGLSAVGLGAKAVWLTFKGVDKGLDALTPAQKTTKIKQFLQGDLDLSALGELSEATQDRLMHARAVQKFAEDPTQLATNPVVQTQIMANNSGFFMRQLDDGTIRLRSMADPRGAKVYNDLFEANKAIAAQVDRVAAKIDDPDIRAQWLEGRAPIKGYIDNYQFSRETYRSASPSTKASQEYRTTISPGEFVEDLRRFRELQNEGKVALVDTFQVATSDLKGTVVPLVKAAGDGLNTGLVVLRKIATRRDFETAVALVKREAIAGVGEEAQVWHKLAQEGFDGVELPNGQLVSLFPENIRVEGAVNPRTGREGTLRVNWKAAETFSPEAKVLIEQDILQMTPSTYARSKETLADSLLGIGVGDVDPKKVQGMVEGYLSGSKRKVGEVTVILDDSIEALKEMRVRVIEMPEGVMVRVPSMIAGPETFRVFAKNMIDALERKTVKGLQEVFEGKMPLTKKVVGTLEANMQVLPNAPGDVQLDWIKRVVKGAGAEVQALPKGQYAVQAANGVSRVYKSLDDLAKSIYFQSMTKESLKVQLAKAGYQMVEQQGLLVVRGKTGGRYWTGATPEEVLRKMGWAPKRLNAKYAPTVAVNVEGAKLVLEGDAIVGGGMELRRYLDSFEDFLKAETEKVAHRSPKGVISEVSTGVYQVEIPRFGIAKEFTNMGEARRFLETDWSTFENLQEAASRRGWSLTVEGSNWRLRGAEVDVLARTPDEVGAALKMSPDPVFAPPILGDEIEGSLSLFVKDHPMPVGFEVTKPRFLNAPEWAPKIPGLGVRSSVAYGTAPMRDFVRLVSEDLSKVENWLRVARLDDAPLPKQKVEALKRWAAEATEQGRVNIQKAAGLTDEEIELVSWVKTAAEDKTLFELSRTLARQASLAISESGKGNAIFNDLLSPNKKLLSAEKRKGLFYYLQATDEGARVAAAQKFRLTSDDIEIGEKIREVLGRNKYEGLFVKFGIDPSLFLFDYMPRIRKVFETMKPAEINKMGMDEFMAKVFGKENIPREFGFFAEHQRLAELATFALDDDILSVLHKYNNMGTKKLFLNDTWRNLYEYLDSDVGRKLPVAIHHRMNMYRQQIMSVYTSDAEQVLQDFVTKFMQRLGKDGITSMKAGQQFLSKVMSLNYLTTMGWRPWLPIRNLFQVFSTLSPRFGNESTLRAIREVVNDSSGEIVRVMKNLGIIQDVPPIVHQLAASETRLGRVTSGALKWYKNSDDITRAIAFKVAWNTWNDGVARLQKGVLKGKKSFLEYTQANLLGDKTADMIWDLLQKGKVEQARNLFGFEVVADTMFLYQRAEGPAMFQGLIGKLFGQYGTYSANYRQNIWKGLKYGTLAQRTAFVARFVGNSAALYGTFKALGIQEKNFLPWTPVGFSGGPLFNAGLTALQATQDNYKGRQARAELKHYLTVFVPGSYQYRTVEEFLKETEKGNSYRAFLALLDLPLATE